jgi:hypothetical protein
MHLVGEGGTKLFRVANRYDVGLFLHCTLEYGGGSEYGGESMVEEGRVRALNIGDVP